MTEHISQERLKELLVYNARTGVFTNRVTRGSRALAGTEAGSVQKKGYIEICLDGRAYYAHRLAWLYVTGRLPQVVDHKNKVRTDNRWRNLRDVTPLLNAHNLSKRVHNTSGFTGAFRLRNKWRSQIKIAGKQCHLGVFNTAREAHLAYKEAVLQRAKLFSQGEASV